MKRIIQIFYLFPALFIVAVTSCQKEPMEPVTELAIDSEQKVIAVEKNGIGIEFCLLNEKGEPDTVFNEGENFKFHLAIINNVEPDTSMFIVSDFLGNPGLFMVFESNSDTIGKPINWCLTDLRSDASNRINHGEKWYMEIPWHETRGIEVPFDYHNLIGVFQQFFMGLDQPPLSKGKYYTKITQQFCLGKYLPHPQSEFVCTDTLTLKINFEIK
ncbi:MAG: hypothetical protein HQ543_00215 [Bacteroidetes bacterium]|nr:hypothetical protein [Bacteroidota bacterium]